MSLRSQLTDILPSLLPGNPSGAVKGTELIRMARLQLKGSYSDASLRYHFSIMSCDPNSPIAKVEKGQGYYRRSAAVPARASTRELLSLSQGRLDELSADHEAVDLELDRLRKFRAVVTRFHEGNGRFPFVFRQSFSDEASPGSFWKLPEIVLVDWETGDAPDEEFALDPTVLSLKQRLGLPPFRLHAARLRIEPSLAGFREDFFQTLSASMWAQGGELIYAAPVEDEALADGLRRLNSVFGIGVVSFGLTAEALDDLPGAIDILHAHPRETEAIMERLDLHRIAAPHSRQHLDWQALESLRRESGEIKRLFSWLDACISVGRAEAYHEES